MSSRSLKIVTAGRWYVYNALRRMSQFQKVPGWSPTLHAQRGAFVSRTHLQTAALDLGESAIAVGTSMLQEPLPTALYISHLLQYLSRGPCLAPNYGPAAVVEWLVECVQQADEREVKRRSMIAFRVTLFDCQLVMNDSLRPPTNQTCGQAYYSDDGHVSSGVAFAHVVTRASERQPVLWTEIFGQRCVTQ